ncbi:hypothetical protein K469DRAFT_631331 [Zopfia rhizophila CBS 207.26]|uniref:Uncharacterized protein n=1 Tax=Zopfia rhizophila CBS 207.26 TaxID=1314779 RepID=A0A6A6E707_9PEZI|nr:hypothetical protein K469DRAFT_631331 [Zopfia rhizophila CBS 207.26]
MYMTIFFSTLVVAAIALPAPQTEPSPDSQGWKPAPNSVVTCDTTSDKIVSFYVGPQQEQVLGDACGEMMPPCASGNGDACPAVMDWELEGPATSTQSANVESAENGNKMSGWAVQFNVTPPPKIASTPVMWQYEECKGYFRRIVEKQLPEGCHNSMGSGIGSIKVGGDGSLKDAVFEIKIVKK